MLEPVEVPPIARASGEPAEPKQSGLLSGGAALAASSMLGNAFGALITVALARTFSGAAFGGITALLSVALVATVPATGLQFVIARRTSRAELDATIHDRSGMNAAVLLGAGLAALLAAAAPILAAFLDVPTLAILVIGLTLPPYVINAAQLGTLLGHASYARFAVAQFALAAFRFLAVLIACLRHSSVTGVLVWLFAATCLTTLCCVGLTGRNWVVRLTADAGLARELGQATLALAGVSVLMNLDILLARHYLSADDSGVYALGSLFAKAGLWAAQFVPQLLFPRLARATHQRALLLRGIAADLAVGALVFGFAAVVARPLLQFVSTDADPVAAARLAPLFAVLGAAWALSYLVLLASVAARNPVPSRLLWAVVSVETVAIAGRWHHSAAEILVTCIIGTLTLVGCAVTSAMRTMTSHGPGVTRSGT